MKALVFIPSPQSLKIKEREQKSYLSLKRRQSWIAKIHREEWAPTKSSHVWSEHFCLVSGVIIIVDLISEKSASLQLVVLDHC